MPATVTLATITLANAVAIDNRHWMLSSLVGVVPGMRLYAGQELVAVEAYTPVANVVIVRRGVDGTITTPHPAGATIYIGRADQFYGSDPMGTPPNPMAVSPYINVVTGAFWTVQGDEVGAGAAARAWVPITTTQAPGALGVRTTTVTTPT